MTESPGARAGPHRTTDGAAPAPIDGDGGPPRPRGPRRHRWPRRRRWMRRAALGTAALIFATAGTGWWVYQKLDGNIRTDTDTANELERYEAERPVPLVRGARNLLLLGSDNRFGGNQQYGKDSGTERSDTAILLHLAADRKSATAVSIPRDLMVDIPDCRRQDGSTATPRFAQFNSAYETGGAACAIRTVERMTGIRIDHHLIVDFSGFKRMVDAVDGVEICLTRPMKDGEARLNLPAGRQTLRGEQALAYVRARYSLGDGSDTDRIQRQQDFLGALVKKVHSNGVLLNPARLYPVLDAATSSLTTDAGLASLRDLYDLVRVMRNVPTEQVQFLTVPRRPYSYDRNRDELVRPEADRLFRQLRLDEPVAVAPEHREATEPRTSPSPSPYAAPSASPYAAPTASPFGSGTAPTAPEPPLDPVREHVRERVPESTRPSTPPQAADAPRPARPDEPTDAPLPGGGTSAPPTFGGTTASGDMCG
ncbi:LCP family glycopolymer transferase [Streptomyces sp. URMC 123]|uniref:LCP family protein n=1 Tax=Streptomyces sp. URMC 123 TaxID=3423403 RepID=UPI003F1CF855